MLTIVALLPSQTLFDRPYRIARVLIDGWDDAPSSARPGLARLAAVTQVKQTRPVSDPLGASPCRLVEGRRCRWRFWPRWYPRNATVEPMGAQRRVSDLERSPSQTATCGAVTLYVRLLKSTAKSFAKRLRARACRRLTHAGLRPASFAN